MGERRRSDQAAAATEAAPAATDPTEHSPLGNSSNQGGLAAASTALPQANRAKRWGTAVMVFATFSLLELVPLAIIMRVPGWYPLPSLEPAPTVLNFSHPAGDISRRYSSLPPALRLHHPRPQSSERHQRGKAEGRILAGNSMMLFVPPA